MVLGHHSRMTANAPFSSVERFPGLRRLGGDKRPFVHADAPGGTHVTDSVIEAMANFQRESNANPHRVFATSLETAGMLQDTRAAFARCAGGDPEGIVFGANTTTLTWHFARAFQQTLKPRDVIVCTQLDHDANVAPWLDIAQRTGAEVRFVRLDPTTFELDLRSLESAADKRTRLIAFTRSSNLIGTTVSPEPFVEAAKATGAITYADGVAAAAHFPLRQSYWGIDVQVCSPYKFFGPHMGVLSASPRLLDRLSPDHVRAAPLAGPRRWETGMPPLASIAGLRAAIQYIREVGFTTIRGSEQALLSHALDAIRSIRSVRLHGRDDTQGRETTFALNVEGISPHVVARRLAAEGIFVSSGHNYAVETVRALGLPLTEGVVRAGFVHYHTLEDIDRTFSALARIAESARP